MNLLVAPFAAVLIGLYVRSRVVAAALFISIEAFLFTFQTLAVLLAWMAGEGGFGGAQQTGAFGPAPTGFPVAFRDRDLWTYGLVNLAILLVGLAATLAIVVRRERRRGAATGAGVDIAAPGVASA